MKYLYEENNKIFARCENCNRVLKFKKYDIDEVKTGVECFCGEMSYSITGLPRTKAPVIKETNDVSSHNHDTVSAQTSDMVPKQVRIQNGPKCPTCGSTKVQKISFTSKAIGGAMWGLFSSNVRNTFQCNNCGYKW